MNLDEYMEKNFPNLLLTPPLFYNCEIGIRFELGDPEEENDKVYLERVYHRSKTLFSAINDDNDDIFIVSHEVRKISEKRKGKRAKFFPSFVKVKNIKYRLQHSILPFDLQDEEENEEWCTHRFSMKCHVKDVSVSRLIKAVFSTEIPWIYFVNSTKGTIFHIYDSRGCDLVATNKDAIENIYIKYNDWILNYDREKIDELFK
ncbi:DUF3885 domain-containing protein [Alkalihalobacillus sp. LMS39]|uniref:DUF3885 domain-containing protein n=1 Tax=Alkalihalobacillus sp. LMS39 TaxID=2924032 RepID=UPI001FB25307|nr:DUF3885 domain-containing protein [Alkalihalobacillus sp. LMS39]UOE93727.1 DUF3885 domain-containing protein [Alkalihalobacillus sp. LMS39]